MSHLRRTVPTMQLTVDLYVCQWCAHRFHRRHHLGRKPVYCRRTCRQRAYEARRRAALVAGHPRLPPIHRSRAAPAYEGGRNGPLIHALRPDGFPARNGYRQGSAAPGPTPSGQRSATPGSRTGTVAPAATSPSAIRRSEPSIPPATSPSSPHWSAGSVPTWPTSRRGRPPGRVLLARAADGVSASEPGTATCGSIAGHGAEGRNRHRHRRITGHRGRPGPGLRRRGRQHRGRRRARLAGGQGGLRGDRGGHPGRGCRHHRRRGRRAGRGRLPDAWSPPPSSASAGSTSSAPTPGSSRCPPWPT